MKSLINTAATAVCAAALLAMAGAAWSDSDHDRARALKNAGDIVSLETILEKARKDQPGRVVETELERKGERYVYEIKIVDDKGGVRKLKYDARTGELIKREDKGTRE
jgi:uncharacterized membrane protein YkoI